MTCCDRCLPPQLLHLLTHRGEEVFKKLHLVHQVPLHLAQKVRLPLHLLHLHLQVLHLHLEHLHLLLHLVHLHLHLGMVAKDLAGVVARYGYTALLRILLFVQVLHLQKQVLEGGFHEYRGADDRWARLVLPASAKMATDV